MYRKNREIRIQKYIDLLLAEKAIKGTICEGYYYVRQGGRVFKLINKNQLVAVN